MIKLFRNIRKTILSENRSVLWKTNYFKYAIGEIFLVVVGILIALQINNWNESRKIQAQGNKILFSIHSDLENCKRELETGAKSSIVLSNRLKKIGMYIEDDLPYDSELDSAFSTLSNWFSPYFSYTSYETLKAKGVNLIQNEDLRENLVLMYERNFPYITDDYDQFLWIYAQNVALPLANKHIEKKLIDGLAQPNDFEKLKGNIEFRNMLAYLIHRHENAYNMYTHYGKSVDTLLVDIEKELSIE